MDVVIAGYNATPLASLSDQSPIELVRRQGNSGSWSFESSHTDTDANNLTCIRLPVRIRGNKKQGRQPFVNFMCARYRVRYPGSLGSGWQRVSGRHLDGGFALHHGTG